eukprot:CAMPEP_0119003676 /NCGR_PEP_ID=MMETSP1176-20130426/707_1 /TAXON_ID=265551 /ORGANISM="Synedropsis recta cf, Strain CCMP1620" /LENGTH=222 /DNA_ID=CAMNT_0006955297 /DNA_START=52 /DNA_END=720 /DNA_ORIENTATION=+
MMQRYGLLILLIAASKADAFIPLAAQRPATVSTTSSSTSALQMAGFGAGAPKKGGKKGTKKRDIKLKATRQWKQYIALPLSERIRVAVRVVESTAPTGADNDVCWFEVGAVKSKEDAHTEAAVIRHRLVMADHARRMFPLKILAKDKLEWGYSTEQGEDVMEWVVADGKQMGGGDSMDNDDVDKLIGFQGLADPTGFYDSTKEVKDTSIDAGFESIMATRRN